jgi:ABC-type enterobactin transport system permease subunit
MNHLPYPFHSSSYMADDGALSIGKQNKKGTNENRAATVLVLVGTATATATATATRGPCSFCCLLASLLSLSLLLSFDLTLPLSFPSIV